MLENMDAPWPEPLVCFAYMAGATKRIRFLSTVLIVPYYQPVALAKLTAQVDYLSVDRLILGVGVGYIDREFEVMGSNPRQRGAQTDETLAAMIELWTKERPSFHGKFVNFDNIRFEPKPVSKPCPPIWVGGHADAALRRAARFGDGWMPWLSTQEDLKRSMDYIRSQPEFRSRSRPFDLYALSSHPWRTSSPTNSWAKRPSRKARTGSSKRSRKWRPWGSPTSVFSVS